MDAGILSRRVTLQTLSTSVDSVGQPIQTWVDVATVWCQVTFVSGAQTLMDNEVTTTTKATLRIRPRAVSPAMRGIVGATTFYVLNVLPDMERREFIDLECEVINGR